METKKISLADGSGGKLTHRLIKNIFLQNLGNPILNRLDDSAICNLQSAIYNLVFTTDSYVIKPIFFPGGDIGKLSICGTINDLSMLGARPLYISLSFILEDGLQVDKLEQIVVSIAETAKKSGVKIVCGDTKVVEKGACDEIFINTSGIGIADKKIDISGHNAKLNDIVILSGTIGDHGIAVLNARQKLGLRCGRCELKSDIAPLNNLVEKMIKVCGSGIHAMRDPTRGGLATALNEIAEQSNVGIEIEESTIPLKKPVESACALLGLDPLYIANEGKLVAIVSKKDAEQILSVMKKHPLGKHAKIIGKVVPYPKGVFLKTKIGGTRILQMLESDQLPRIC
ncbi:MAG: hydrogenase expression/formation protein HypE [Elusimicrobiota bacterium]